MQSGPGMPGGGPGASGMGTRGMGTSGMGTSGTGPGQPVPTTGQPMPTGMDAGHDPTAGPKPSWPPAGSTPSPPAEPMPAGPKPNLQPGPPNAASQPAAPAAAGTATTGGFNDLLDRLRKAGLGDQVDSWVSSGSNQPIDASQVTQAIGAQHLSELAKRAGVSPDEAAQGLAKALPEVVNEVTPHGTADQSQVTGHIQRLFGS
jgi:uncharacterized protein YidB (DUF937 family)